MDPLQQHQFVNNLATISPTNTSCDSLVRVCISKPVSSTLTALTLRFQLSSASTWVQLAEVSFYEDSPTCPSDSILESHTTSEADVRLSVPTTTLRNGNTDTETPPETTETGPTNTETAPSTKTIATIIVVVFIIIIIVVVVTTIVVVICVRAYSSRNEINTTISGEGHTASLGHSHNIDDSQSKFSLCEETGQVYYSTALNK